VSCIAVSVGEQLVKAVLGHRQGSRDREPQPAEAGSPDRDEQGLDRLELPVEVADSSRDEIGSRKPWGSKACEHAETVASAVAAERGPAWRKEVCEGGEEWMCRGS
jgi:hypothetical protein